MPDAEKKILKENMELAEKLGARVITMYGDDVVQQIAEYARMAGVSKIVLGRTKGIGGIPFSRVSFADRLTALGSNSRYLYHSLYGGKYRDSGISNQTQQDRIYI